MILTIGVPSRGRPLELAASIMSLHRTTSQAHDVRYVVAYDDDDYATDEIAEDLINLGLPIIRSRGPRPLGLGELHNRMARFTPADGTFMLWSDRIVPITQHWDHQIAVASMQFPQRVLWMDSIHLAGAGQFILPPLWRAAQGDPCPGVYPFWLEDTVVEEMDAFVHGYPRMAVDARCAGPRSQKTTRMRDLKFWVMHYMAHRPKRIEQAREIAAKLGVVFPDPKPIVAHFEQRDAGYLSRVPMLIEQYGDPAPPDETYLRAKRNAERVLEAMGINWQSWDGIEAVEPYLPGKGEVTAYE